MEKNKLDGLEDHFSKEELGEYVEAFDEEGRFRDDGLYVFPIA